MTEQRHILDESLQLRESGAGTLTGQAPTGYGNMVGVFGGNTAAVLVQAAWQHPDRQGEPVGVTVNFASPLAPGDFSVMPRIIRTNRSTQHFAIEIHQNEQPTTTATAVFANRSETWSSTEASIPDVPPADQVPVVAPLPVAWAQNYELRFVAGALPEFVEFDSQVGQSPESTTTMWIRDWPERPLDFAAVAAICDTFYPRVFLRRGQAVPAGTVSMTVYFHVGSDVLAAQGSNPVLATASATTFNRNYFDQQAQIWGTDGTLLATSHQLVYFKA